MDPPPDTGAELPASHAHDAKALRLTRDIHDPDWRRLRRAFIPDVDDGRQTTLLATLRDNSVDFLALLATGENSEVTGFCELSVRREYVNGCLHNPVLYLEGIYVSPEAQRRGIARRLCDAAGAWGREHGCREFASDVDLDNIHSLAVHAALGFEETGRVVTFRKILLRDDPEVTDGEE